MAHLDYNFLQLQTEDTNLLFRAEDETALKSKNSSG
jgi:hypothetical protein